MRRSLCLLLLAACSGEPSAPHVLPRYQVSGVFMDSVLNRPVSARLFRVNGQAVDTDFLGHYSATVDSGTVLITTDPGDPDWEPYSRSLGINSDLVVNVPLRRVRPVIRQVTYDAASGAVTAVILDLQGGASIRRDNASVALYAGSGFSVTAFSGAWSWTALDPLTWRAAFTTRTGVTSLVFGIEDTEGHIGVMSCTPPPTCGNHN